MESMTIREPEFYNLFHAFMNAALIHLQKRYDSKELLDQKNLRFYKTWLILLNKENSFRDLKEFEEIKKWIEIRPEIVKQFDSYVGYGHVMAQLPLWTVLIRRVYSHIKQSGLEPDVFLINGLYRELEDFLFDKQLYVKLTTPLKGTNIDVHVQIENGLEIRDLKKDNELWEEIHITYPNNGSIRNVIIHEFELHKIIENDLERFYDLTDYHYNKYFKRTSKLMEALRIFKTGNFGALETSEYSPVIHYTTKQLERCAYVEDKFSYKEYDYLFSKTDIDKFQTFWREYNKIGDDERFHSLRWAIEKFMNSYEKVNSIDRVLDFIIILEILLRRNKNEKSNVIVRRIKEFLGNTSVEKNKISSFMTTAYQIRNNIAHGRDEVNFKIDGQPITFKEFTKDLENFVRMCITKFIHLMNNGKTRNDILDQL